MISALETWNSEVMYRMLRLLDEKLREEGRFSSDYFIGILFPVELRGGVFIQKAINIR